MFLRSAAPFVNSLFLGLIIVLSVTPVLYGLRKRGVPGWLAFIITLLVVAAVFLGLVLILIGAVSQFVSAIPTYVDKIDQAMGTLQSTLASLGLEVLEIEIAAILDFLDFGSLLSLTGDFLSGLVGTLSDVVLIALIIIFLLVDALGIPAKMARHIRAGNPIVERFSRYSVNVRRYVGITTIVGLVTGILDTIVFIIIGVDFAVLWGILAFLMSYIPTIGFWIALIPPVILATLEFGFLTGLVVFLAIVVINGFAENVVKPKYMGEGLDLSPFVVVFSVIFWAAVLGSLGTILAVPLTMAFRILVLEADERNSWIIDLMGDAKKHSIATEQGDGDVELAEHVEDDLE
jgi:predicted PurR-regulated permease PerM